MLGTTGYCVFFRVGDSKGFILSAPFLEAVYYWVSQNLHHGEEMKEWKFGLLECQIREKTELKPLTVISVLANHPEFLV